MAPQPEEEADRGRAREISTELVKLYKDRLGRGPTKAYCSLTDDLVVCVFRDTMTTLERTFMGAGEEGSILDLRRSLQDAMRGESAELIERMTSRRVSSTLSDYDPANDIAVEVFVLEAKPRERGDGND